jgi:hypothetical protein
MKRKNLLLPILILLLFCNCQKDNNPIIENEPGIGQQKLLIMTDSSLYIWKMNEYGYRISIQGTLLNKSDTVYYSRIGDGYGPPEQTDLIFAGNSGGYLEKYNPNKEIWEEQGILSFLFEGSKMVPIKPSQTYSIRSLLSSNGEANDTGIYRFRVDYYDLLDPDSSIIPDHNYSNTFELR